MSIQVPASYLTASGYLSQLKAAKNRFVKPNFKSTAKKTEIPTVKLAARLRGEEFESNRGKELHAAVLKVISETKGWDLLQLTGPGQKSADQKTDQKDNLTSKLTQDIRDKARAVDQARQKRLDAAVFIQKHARMWICSEKVETMRRERQAARSIQAFFFKLVFRRKKIDAGLEALRQHFCASVITRFIREVAVSRAARRKKFKRNQRIRALFAGVKARMIFSLARMKETKALIMALLEELDNPELDAEGRRTVVDDLKYQRNLYLNIFNKFWFKKTSVLEEQTREREKEKKRRSSPLVQPDHRPVPKRTSVLSEVARSKFSSRKPSHDASEEPKPHFVDPDDRPIKPMALSYSALGPADGDLKSSSIKDKSRGKKDKKADENKQVSDKVKQQRELVDKRRKYDPRKALAEHKHDNDGKLGKSDHSHKLHSQLKGLDNIAENMSEDRSGFIAADGLNEHTPKVKKEFLKRKTKKVEFKKLDWTKVERRIDCWVPKENIPDKKESFKKNSPRNHHKSFTTPPSHNTHLKDSDAGRGKQDEQKKLTAKKPGKAHKSEENTIAQIEQTLNSNYLPKLEEIFTKEITVHPDSKIPTLKSDSRFILHIEESDLRDVLEELEEEYDFLVHI